MDKPMTFERWFKTNGLSLAGKADTRWTWDMIAKDAWHARDAELDALRKENKKMRDGFEVVLKILETTDLSKLNDTVKWADSLYKLRVKYNFLTSTPAKEEK